MTFVKYHYHEVKMKGFIVANLFLICAQLFSAHLEVNSDAAELSFNAWLEHMKQCPEGECPLAYHLDGLEAAFKISGDSRERIRNAANAASKIRGSGEKAMLQAWKISL
jgi:hypothetical protein